MHDNATASWEAALHEILKDIPDERRGQLLEYLNMFVAGAKAAWKQAEQKAG